jgi:RHS repeat-associated protein
MPPPSVDGNNPGPSGCGECQGNNSVGDNAQAGDPIDLSSGLMSLRSVDLAVSGSRGSLSIPRVYRTLSSNSGAFGLGSETPLNYSLDTLDPQSAQAINLIAPDGNRFPFNAQHAGTFVNTSVPWLQGAVLTATGPTPQTGTANVANLRFKDGTVWTFEVTENDIDVTGCNFIGFALLGAITDRFGNQTTLTRNCKLITAITDPVGRQLTLTYSGNNIASITDPIGRTVLYTYNPSGTLATVTDPNGGLTKYFYDGQNRMTSMIDPRGVTMFQNTFDGNGRVTQQVAADGGVFQFAYTLVNPTAPTSPVMTTTATDPLGHQTTYRFNPQGYVIQVTDPQGQTTAFNRASGTNLLLSKTGNAVCPVCGPPGMGNSSYTYDVNGNRLTSTDALGNTTTYTYDAVFNQVTSVTDPLGDTTTFDYDGLGNLTRITDPNGNKSTFTYNANGLLVSSTDALGNTSSIGYDSLSNPVSITDPLGKLSTKQFDGVSRLTATTDPMGRTSKLTYDKLNRIVSSTDGRGATTQFAYDPAGNLLKLTDARSNATAFFYDNLSRVTSRTSPLGKTETYQYDSDSNLTTFTDRRGQTSKFQYDALNRLAMETYQDGSTVTRAYDPYSRVLAINDSAGGLFTFGYDGAGSLIAQAEPTGSIAYTRDPLHRVATRQVVGQNAVTYSYDPAGNLLGAAMPNAGMTYSYDGRNLPTLASRTNGVASNMTYDPLGRVLSITHAKGATALNSQTYAYDPAGSLTSATNDIAQPLITQSASSTVDNGNELLTNGPTTYTYDANGNRLTETGPSGTLTYTWDSRNRLSSITDASGKTTVMHYDFERNLMEIDRVTGGSTTTQKFLVDSLTNVVSLTDTSGLPISVLTGRSIDSHYGSVDSLGNVAFGIGDQLGSTAALTSAAGAVTAKLDYEPFGQTTGTQAPAYPFGYTGRINVQGNIYYNRARFYDAAAGRFLSEDPKGFVAGNLYSYGSNSPVNRVDPLGLTDYNEQQTQQLLQQAYDSSTAGRLGGLWNIFNNSKGNGPYDFSWNEATESDTWTRCGKTYNAGQFGNYVAGFQGAAYDQKYFWTTGAIWAETAVKGFGILYHIIPGQSKAVNDPFDRTGFPDINAGEKDGWNFGSNNGKCGCGSGIK